MRNFRISTLLILLCGVATTVSCGDEQKLVSSGEAQWLGEAPKGTRVFAIKLLQGTVLKRLKNKPHKTTSGVYGDNDLCFLPHEVGTITLKGKIKNGDTHGQESKIVAREGTVFPALLRPAPKPTPTPTPEPEADASQNFGLPQALRDAIARRDEELSSNAETEPPPSNTAQAPEGWEYTFDPNRRVGGKLVNAFYSQLKAKGIRFANETKECPFGYGWIFEGHVSGNVKEGGFVRPYAFNPIRTCYSRNPGYLVFGWGREGGYRRHAGCDIHGRVGSPIVAIGDGKVIGSYDFYGGTCAIEILHPYSGGNFLARYGEVDCRSKVRKGATVKKGQRIGKVGHLTITPDNMLHFELYSAERSGKLTTFGSPGRPREYFNLPANNPGRFFRRRDLMNPTWHIQQWKKN